MEFFYLLIEEKVSFATGADGHLGENSTIILQFSRSEHPELVLDLAKHDLLS